ncbi:hypothetical protein HYFRA_00011374 [Hymenoscyphus fraxineus]|uniref:Uncharacterized protein n=1 Tax=Hymenoscyphus fraxineus TaxID=746836 RepID=A0A9N9KW20_9HELO|nr:hypothetical protein HYFRA_00011374 [Hymenoscyphus fraxineus]
MPNHFKEFFQRQERNKISGGAAAGVQDPSKNDTEQHAEQIGGDAPLPPYQQKDIAPPTPSSDSVLVNPKAFRHNALSKWNRQKGCIEVEYRCPKNNETYTSTIPNINFEDEDSFGVDTIKKERCKNTACSGSIFATMDRHEYSIVYNRSANNIRFTYYCPLRNFVVDLVIKSELLPEYEECRLCAKRIMDETEAFLFESNVAKSKRLTRADIMPRVCKERLGGLAEWEYGRSSEE